MESEKLPSPRTPMNMEVCFKRSYAREESVGFIKNLSLTGAFLAFQAMPMQPGEKINIRLQVEDRLRKIPAVVVWSNSVGCGILFQPTNNRDRQIVDDLIYFHESGRELRRSVLQEIFKKVA